MIRLSLRSLALLLLLLDSSVYAQVIIGKVFDVTANKSIEDVIVLVKPSQDKISAIQATDPEGNFFFNNVRLKDFIIQTQHVGYHDKIIEHLNIPESDTLRINIKLTPSSVVLEEITVKGEKKDMELEAAGFYTRRMTRDGRFYTNEDLKNVAGNNMKGLLTSLLGIKFQGDDNLFYFNRYLNIGAPIRFYVDGVLLDQEKFGGPGIGKGSTLSVVRRSNNPLGATPPNPIEYINPNDIKAIEIYPSSLLAPFEYGGGQSPGGVIIIWTGR